MRSPAAVFRPDGTAADLSKVRQTDLFVVVIKGTRTDASQSAQTLVVDLLPAGFEIETATVSKGRSTTDYSWLPELTEATYTEQRDDRYHRRARPQRRRQGLHPRLCRARRHAGRIQIPGARRRGHVRARDHRAHRDRQADRRCRGRCQPRPRPSPRRRGEGAANPRAACGEREGPRACGRVRGWRAIDAPAVALPQLRLLYFALPPPSLDRSRDAVGARPRARRVDPARLSDRRRQMAAAGRARQGRSALSPHADRRRGSRVSHGTPASTRSPRCAPSAQLGD